MIGDRPYTRPGSQLLTANCTRLAFFMFLIAISSKTDRQNAFKAPAKHLQALTKRRRTGYKKDTNSIEKIRLGAKKRSFLFTG